MKSHIVIAFEAAILLLGGAIVACLVAIFANVNGHRDQREVAPALGFRLLRRFIEHCLVIVALRAVELSQPIAVLTALVACGAGVAVVH